MLANNLSMKKKSSSADLFSYLYIIIYNQMYFDYYSVIKHHLISFPGPDDGSLEPKCYSIDFLLH